MRNVTLAVLGFVGLSLLLCGSGEALAQTDTTDTTDSRVQGTAPGDVRVGGTGTQTAAGGVTTASGADASSAALRQTVLQLQSEVAQLRQDLARVRSELASVAASSRSAASGTGTAAATLDAGTSGAVGGSGQAGVAPSAGGSGSSTVQDTSGGGTSAQSAVSGEPLRAGTAQETGARGAQAPDTANSGAAVVDAIYTGTVRSVSARQLVLVDEAGQPFTVELGNQTRVLRNGQRISAQELKKGTRVRATVDMLSGRNQATVVTTLTTK
ncbi:hypothetical protein [Hyalangium minutum]|uniref:Uncharacterized protein n=1 Tax=Hyalangium minutum TaxID=394096 RepID=A0A085WEZ8_9BACT|nr:hypothetical protein [Hyalangium minutum]KFE66261.1 hypothetical protein DB31_1326 [Hyalangium minutum]